MEIKIEGIDELKDAVARLGLFAKTMQMAADKMDDALAAHIAALDNHATRMEAIWNAKFRGDNSPQQEDLKSI